MKGSKVQWKCSKSKWVCVLFVRRSSWRRAVLGTASLM